MQSEFLTNLLSQALSGRRSVREDLPLLGRTQALEGAEQGRFLSAQPVLRRSAEAEPEQDVGVAHAPHLLLHGDAEVLAVFTEEELDLVVGAVAGAHQDEGQTHCSRVLRWLPLVPEHQLLVGDDVLELLAQALPLLLDPRPLFLQHLSEPLDLLEQPQVTLSLAALRAERPSRVLSFLQFARQEEHV